MFTSFIINDINAEPHKKTTPKTIEKFPDNIVGTGQIKCYNNSTEIPYPKPGRSFFGQDAEFTANAPSYQDNRNGTVTDINTGLMWSKAVDTDKVSLTEAEKIAEKMKLGGYSDWRVPNIKELYSLINFSGYTGFSRDKSNTNIPANAIPFINTDYFDFKYGNTASGERYIDAQWLSTNKYVSTTMNGDKTLFGVNFADGRIKGYGYKRPRSSKIIKFYARYVRGNRYGQNKFKDNGDGTITDLKTGLMWMKSDSRKGMNWQQALKYAYKLKYAGYSDWRLPNAKELQYIVDYTRSPDTTSSPAINSLFKTSGIKNEAGKKDYPYFWTSTTHLDGPKPGSSAAYISFGRALGKMHGRFMDVHGAGAQRSDPKIGMPTSRGPQGDMIRVNNYVRCVRGGFIKFRTHEPQLNNNKYPYNINLKDFEVTGSSQRTSQKKSDSHPFSRNFVRRLDKNGDGKVSRSEFDGPPGRFDFHDTNHDGYLSKNEAPKNPPPKRFKNQY